MVTLFICSTSTFSGKSIVAIGIAKKLQSQGFSVGYMKPFGTNPTQIDGQVSDEHAVFTSQAIGLSDPPELVCPIVETQDLKISTYKNGPDSDLMERIVSSHDQLSRGRDVMIVEGGRNLVEGRSYGIANRDIAKVLKAKVIVVDKYYRKIFMDDILEARDTFGEDMIGVILNQVPDAKIDYIERLVRPYLEKQGVSLLGALTHNTLLHAVPVADLIATLQAEVLCCEEQTELLVEHLCIGAMNVDGALRYFRRLKNKAVITGGDRADIQLAALETSTRCIILTGNLYPNSIIIAKAEEKGVPILLVKFDTLTTVELFEELIGHTGVHEKAKLGRIEEVIRDGVSVGKIVEKLGL